MMRSSDNVGRVVGTGFPLELEQGNVTQRCYILL